jgi:hypothetical protein
MLIVYGLLSFFFLSFFFFFLLLMRTEFLPASYYGCRSCDRVLPLSAAICPASGWYFVHSMQYLVVFGATARGFYRPVDVGLRSLTARRRPPAHTQPGD